MFFKLNRQCRILILSCSTRVCFFCRADSSHSVLPIFRYFESPDNMKQLLYLFPRQKYWDKCSLDFSNLERISVPLGDSKNRYLCYCILACLSLCDATNTSAENQWGTKCHKIATLTDCKVYNSRWLFICGKMYSK